MESDSECSPPGEGKQSSLPQSVTWREWTHIRRRDTPNNRASLGWRCIEMSERREVRSPRNRRLPTLDADVLPVSRFDDGSVTANALDGRVTGLPWIATHGSVIPVGWSTVPFRTRGPCIGHSTCAPPRTILTTAITPRRFIVLTFITTTVIITVLLTRLLAAR